MGERTVALEMQERDVKAQLRDIGRLMADEYKKVNEGFETKYLVQQQAVRELQQQVQRIHLQQ